MKNINPAMIKKVRQFLPSKLLVITFLGTGIGMIQGLLASTLFYPSIFPMYDKAVGQQFSIIAHSLRFIHSYVPAKALATYLHYASTFVTLLSCFAIMEPSKLGHTVDSIGNHTLAFWNICLIILQLYAGISFEVCIPTVAFTIILIIRLCLINQLDRSKRGSSSMKTRSTSKRKTTTPRKYKA